jgi:F0F1-type ATP synthase assembly protein I
MNDGLRYAQFGFQLVATIGLLGGLGWWADRAWGTAPWLLLLGCMLGIGIGLWQLLRAFKPKP